MSKILPFSSTRYEPLITPIELGKQFPATIAQRNFVEQSREQIIRILNGVDERLLLILGPCSIHDLKSAIHYAKKLKELTAEISDVFFPVMRVYFEKSRTALGWKGLMYDPHIDNSNDLNTGLRLIREFLLILADFNIPAASEILDPISGQYFGELLSWGCIGARTSSSQVHRQIASGLPMPIAFKNNTDGNTDIAIHGILTASQHHVFVGNNESGNACVMHTEGNPHCHLVLRGGKSGPNYDSESIKSSVEKLKKAGLPPIVLVDCSHDNSKRDYKKQPEVFESVIEQAVEGNRAIRGVILESHLRAGSQKIPSDPNLLKYAISLTDACMDWETTEGIILAAKKTLMAKNPSLQSEKPHHPLQNESEEAALI